MMERAVIVAGSSNEPHHLSPYAGKLNAAITPVFDEIMPWKEWNDPMKQPNWYGESWRGRKGGPGAQHFLASYNKLKKCSNL